MAAAEVIPLEQLYEQDETAWLDQMAELIEHGQLDALDYSNLADYLKDMATSGRREVRNRLKILLMHLLKWEHQPTRRTRSWRTTVLNQQQELADLASRGVLKVYAGEILKAAYQAAVNWRRPKRICPKQRFHPNVGTRWTNC